MDLTPIELISMEQENLVQVDRTRCPPLTSMRNSAMFPRRQLESARNAQMSFPFGTRSSGGEDSFELDVSLHALRDAQCRMIFKQ